MIKSLFNPNGLKVVEAESFEQRLERQYSIADHRPTFISRGVYNNKDPKENCCAVRGRPEGNYLLKEYFYGANVVTNDGDIYYAKKGAGETPAANEGASRLELANPSTETSVLKTHDYGNLANAITGSRQVFDTSPTVYPRTNDNDTDNADRATDTITYRVTYTAASFTATPTTVKNGVIHDNSSPGVDSKCICFFAMGGSAFEKTSNDTLKFFVNHNQNGV